MNPRSDGPITALIWFVCLVAVVLGLMLIQKWVRA
jgi:cytochrome c-type biogenesis protein CcmH/NrfF